MAADEYYNDSGAPSTSAELSSAVMRAEFALINTGFGKLPDLAGNGNKIVVVNAGGTALTVLAAVLALSAAFTLTGGHATTFTTTGTTGVTLPTTGTLATLAGVESLSNKTLTTPVLGVATATSINKVAITAPATSATLTLADGSSLVTSGANSITLTSTGATNVTLSTSGRLGITLTAEQASTSGTSIDFTGIPAGVKRITIMFAGVSTSGTSMKRIRIGDSGGIETTSYTAMWLKVTSAAAVTAALDTVGFDINSVSSSEVLNGFVTLNLQDAADNTWTCGGSLAGGTTGWIHVISGIKALSGVLDRVRITTANGTDTFTAGAISISYE